MNGPVEQPADAQHPHANVALPVYLLEIGANISAQTNADDSQLLAGLSDYEREVGFLIVLNWSGKLIAQYLNQARPRRPPRSTDAVYKCRNRICDKLGLTEYSNATLKDRLVSLGLHQKVPASFFRAKENRTDR